MTKSQHCFTKTLCKKTRSGSWFICDSPILTWTFTWILIIPGQMKDVISQVSKRLWQVTLWEKVSLAYMFGGWKSKQLGTVQGRNPRLHYYQVGSTAFASGPWSWCWQSPEVHSVSHSRNLKHTSVSMSIISYHIPLHMKPLGFNHGWPT